MKKSRVEEESLWRMSRLVKLCGFVVGGILR